jgi:xanthine dehydrogenase accessory factor
MEVYQHIPEFLKKHKSVALCVVTHSEGSTPRKAGAKMLVASDGTIAGTIGGGAVEVQVIEEAKLALRQNQAVHKSYNLKKDLNMQCGGSMEIFIDPIGVAPRLYIFGAGHVGKSLAALGHRFGFEISMLDFRPIEFTEDETVHYQIVPGHYFETLDTLDYDENTFIAIMSPSHEHDFELLRRLGKKSFAYLGMIASSGKVARAKELLIREEQVFTEEEFARFDTPMGLKIAAETPDEIALSILAKLIDVRNAKIKA